jgi:hypothetical protein
MNLALQLKMRADRGLNLLAFYATDIAKANAVEPGGDAPMSAVGQVRS